jgi:hypothetical protein
MQICDGKKAVFQSVIRGSEKYLGIIIVYFCYCYYTIVSERRSVFWRMPNKKARRSGPRCELFLFLRLKILIHSVFAFFQF